jgi:hypothetical protein
LLKISVCGLLKKISEADAQSGVLEYWNIGILGFERMRPSFHHSILPLFQAAVPCGTAIERNDAYEAFSAAR